MTQVHVLADNTVESVTPAGLHGEWGFAALVDGVLLDAGQTGVAARNAQALGHDPSVDDVVLSHGHWDHTGGLPAFFGSEPRVYLHPLALEPKYKDDRFIGLPYTRQRLEADADLVLHREPVEVADGITALGEVPRKHPDNPTGKTVDGSGQHIDDRVMDDQSLAVETADGIAIVLGCCHAGLRNTIEHAEDVSDADVTAIIGGTHLTAMDAGDVEDLARWLEPRLEVVAPCHCTGADAERRLHAVFGDAFVPTGVGTTIEL